MSLRYLGKVFCLLVQMIVLLPSVLASIDNNALREIDLFNMGGSYRLSITCANRVSYVNRFDADVNGLSVFLRNTVVDLDKKTFKYKTGYVREIIVRELPGAIPVARIDVYFTEDVDYRIQKNITGVILVDIERKYATLPANGKVAESVNVPVMKFGDLGQREERELKQDPKNGSAEAYLQSRTVSKPPENIAPDALRSSERITLDVRATEISNVLRLLAKQSKLNIVASNEVAGKVTISLTRVTVREALDMIVKANGLDYTIYGDVVLVKPRDKLGARELETKVYRLKYIDANNLKQTVAQILSPAAKVQVFYQSFNEVTTAKKESDAEQKSRSSTLIITDLAENMRQLDAILEALDVPTPQIMIEAKLVEISPQNQQSLGINWDKSISAGIFNEILLPSGQPLQYSGQKPLEGGGVNYGTLTVERYDAVLNFLSSETNSKLVSNPRIMAMDNQEAIISVGTTFPIPQINRGVGGQGDVVTFEYRDVNIELRVTPHVGDDGTITLFVNPQVEEVIGEVSAGGNSAPITSKRTVETVVNLKSNDTMVIGGLIRENTIDSVEKVWLLGDIPLVGNFFRNKEKSKTQTDLLIFITPRLVNN